MYLNLTVVDNFSQIFYFFLDLSTFIMYTCLMNLINTIKQAGNLVDKPNCECAGNTIKAVCELICYTYYNINEFKIQE